MPVNSAWTDPNALDLTTGQVLTQTVWEAALGNLLWLFGITGAGTNFTPTLSQPGSLTVTVNLARYLKVGKWAFVQMVLTAGAAGTGGNDVVVGAIPAAIVPLTSSAVMSVGSFLYAGTTRRVGTVIQASTTTLKFAVDNNVGAFGTLPNVALANNDVLTIQAAWETT